MEDTKHVSQQELLEMLAGENETPEVNRIGDHLDGCSSCRDKLDQLAAGSVIWEKAPDLLKSDLPARSGLSSIGLETTDMPASRDRNADGQQWSWPIESILESPNHPEMLGRIGDYDIEREIGRGGMGIVLKAYEAELNRPLAIKVLAPHLASHGTARQRFAQEARAAAGVIHPNVIAVHRVENSGKTPYIVMQYIAGLSLQTLVEQKGPLAEDDIVRMALQIAAGLTAAHSQGLVHRDIKPANILVTEGGNRVMITDFGLARAEDDASLTRTGWLTGTPNYMSPEQTRGERLDQRSDLFSLDSLIYFLATGRLPFRSESPLGVLRRIQDEKPTPVRQVNRNISRTLQDIIDVLLEKDPEDRFQTAAELHDVLSKLMFFLHQPDVSQPPLIKKKLVSDGSSRKYLWGGIASGAAALALAGMFLLPQEDGAKEQSQDSDKKPVVIVQAEDWKEPRIVRMEEPKAKVKFSLGDNGAAIAAKLEFDPDFDGEPSFDKGLAQLEKEQYEAAIKSFSVSAKDENFEGMSLYNIGCAEALSGDIEDAVAQLELAVDAGYDSLEKFKHDSDLDPLRNNESFKELLADLKELQQARELLGDAIELSKRDDFRNAVSMFRGVLEADPNNENAWLNLGYALHMQKKYDEAMKWHKKAAEGRHHAAVGNYNVACVHAIRGQKDLAFASLNKAFEHGLDGNLDVDFLNDDEDLDSLRDDPRYEKFIARFQEARHEREDESCDECEECRTECEDDVLDETEVSEPEPKDDSIAEF